MPKQKTRKTVSKRFKQTNPRGHKASKIMYNKSKQGHLRTKKTSRAKGRTISNVKLTTVGHSVISKMNI